MKKALIALAGVVLVVVIGVAVAGWWILGRSTSPEHGATHGPVTTIVDGYVACYLVDVGAKKFALIDACQDPDATVIKQVLEEKGATTDDVIAVFLTHGHSDHVGGTRTFDRAQVFAHPDEVPLIEGDENYSGTLTQYDDGPTAEVTGRMTNEQSVGIGNKLFETFHVPGHTPGSMVVLVDGVLLLGDVGNAREPDVMVPPPEPFSEDPAKAIESLANLADELGDRKIKHILPAHSGPLDVSALAKFAEGAK